MPEGDTIHRLARRLGPDFIGGTLAEVWLREVPGGELLEEGTITAVEAVGKHLLIEVDCPDGVPRILRTHLGMHGGWRRAAVGAMRDPHQVRVALRFSGRDVESRCLRAAQVEVFRASDRGRHPTLSRLGPDLIGDPDLDVVVERARRHPSLPLGELLLRQDVAAGVGNVYKSELLFRARLHPDRLARSVDAPTLRSVYADASDLLRRNVGLRFRTTTFGPEGARARVRGIRLFVYERGGRPCLRCGAVLRVGKQGDQARVTFWCQGCQPR